MTIVCRHCNASEGFYVRERVSGSSTTYYTKTGDFMADQSSMYDHLNHHGGTVAYCMNCHKAMGKKEDFESGDVEKEATFY
ncbi:hypothetical protein ACFTQ7_08560 [Lysinibacillus sp. NPDC056959]|uniref:hypothetical protein n=1 Tax=Lysinibacillus sp. NPDC056959 TaxID=3345981 RepID=UPI003637544A